MNHKKTQQSHDKISTDDPDNYHNFMEQSEYLQHLRTQCIVRYTALKTAQNLISAYQKDNQSLRKDNLQLRAIIQRKQEQQNIKEMYEQQIQSLQKALLKYSQKINQLLEKVMNYEHKIHELMKQNEKYRFQNQQGKKIGQHKIKLLETEAIQIKQNDKIQKQRIKTTKKDFNYSSYEPNQKKSQKIVQMRMSRSRISQISNNYTSLQEKLKQKDEEIIYLLQKLRHVEKKISKKQISGQEKIFTTENCFHKQDNKKPKSHTLYS